MTGNMRLNQVKVGQIYMLILDWDVWSIITVTNIDEGIIHTINREGFTETYSSDSFDENCYKLLKEYPTWIDALNSEEFR